ncbi:hypothetical protein [Arthrobacter celericrescens]|uniref:hypothetical protein n=1 Tax=Arthrobacter celericrescens TaxID=2320851 RepID=UPI000EA184C2|nr:hypothetical protein [Arthrobacter celericrescens]
MPRRGWRAFGRAAAALCLAALFLGSTPSVALAEPDLLLEGRGRAPAALFPGSTSSWVLGITTKEVRLSDLSLHLSVAGSLPGAADKGLEDLLTVEVTACPGRWSAGQCAAGPQKVVPRTPLASLDGTIHSLAVPDGGLPAGVELLAAVTLSPAAGNAVQGLSVRLTARVDAAGEPLTQRPDTQVPDGGQPPGGALADTGFRLGGLALLGAAAVAAGIATAAWARRTAARNTAAERKVRA